MRKAKIVCTIGPATNTQKMIRELIRNGMDVSRLNFSHGDHKTHADVISLVRRESSRQKKTVAILQDLQGIKIRVGNVEGDGIFLKTGQDISILPGQDISTPQKLFVSYPALLRDVKEREMVVLDDGLIKLCVHDKSTKELRAKVMEGGLLKSKKGVNLPASKTSLHAFTVKDRRDLEFGLAAGVDYIAVSFVRTPEDIEIVLRWAKKKGIELPPLIAKIEKPEAINNINGIIDIVDGIMVARGDLGVEMPVEKVPMIQKMLIDLANKRGKLVITATQMLESMTHHTRPTRAEASDVANAVLDGTDALMLSAETASGEYPIEALKMMDTIIRYTEEHFFHKIQSPYQPGDQFPEAVSDGACNAARDIGATAIVVFTNKGYTARLLSKIKPNVPVIAFTPDARVLGRMPLYWGVTGRMIKRGSNMILDTDCMDDIEKSLIRDGIVKKGDSIVLVASSPFLGKANIIRLHKI